MLFEGRELREKIGRTSTHIELRNEYGRCCRILPVSEALALDLNLFVGIGNRRRIRFLRPRSLRCALNAGSHTTERLKGMGGIRIAHPLIREHRQAAANSNSETDDDSGTQADGRFGGRSVLKPFGSVSLTTTVR